MTSRSASRLPALAMAIALALQPCAQAAGWAKIALDFGLTTMKRVYGDPKEPCDNPGGPQNAKSAAKARRVMGATMGAALGLAIGGSIKDGADGAKSGQEALDGLAAWSRTQRTPVEVRDAKVCVLLRTGRELLMPAIQDLYTRYGTRCDLAIGDVDIHDPRSADPIQDCLRDDASARTDLLAFRDDVVLQNRATCRAIQRYIAAWTAEQAKKGYGQGMLTIGDAFCPLNPP